MDIKAMLYNQVQLKKNYIILILIILLLLCITPTISLCQDSFKEYLIKKCYNLLALKLKHDSFYQSLEDIHMSLSGSNYIFKTYFFKEILCKEDYIQTFLHTLDWNTLMITHDNQIIHIIDAICQLFVDYTKIQYQIFRETFCTSQNIINAKNSAMSDLIIYSKEIHMTSIGRSYVTSAPFLEAFMNAIDWSIYIQSYDHISGNHAFLKDLFVSKYMLLQKDYFFTTFIKHYAIPILQSIPLASTVAAITYLSLNHLFLTDPMNTVVIYSDIITPAAQEALNNLALNQPLALSSVFFFTIFTATIIVTSYIKLSKQQVVIENVPHADDKLYSAFEFCHTNFYLSSLSMVAICLIISYVLLINLQKTKILTTYALVQRFEK